MRLDAADQLDGSVTSTFVVNIAKNLNKASDKRRSKLRPSDASD